MKELVIFVSLVSRVCFQIISIQVLAEYSISGQTWIQCDKAVDKGHPIYKHWTNKDRGTWLNNSRTPNAREFLLSWMRVRQA